MSTGRHDSGEVERPHAPAEAPGVEGKRRSGQGDVAIAASDAHLRTLFERAPIAILVTDLDGHIVEVNPAAEEFLGYWAAELRGCSAADLASAEALEHERPRLHALLEGRSDRHQQEEPLVDRSGQVRWCRVTVTVVPGSDGRPELLMRMIEDLTRVHRAEEALSHAQQRLHEAFDEASIGMALVGSDGRWLEVNRALCQLLGRPSEELTRLTFADISHPDDLAASLAARKRLLAGLDRSYQGEQRYLRPDGSVVDVLLSVTVLPGWGADTPIFFVQGVDITERKRAQEALSEREAQLRAVFEQAPIGITLNSLDGRFLDANPCFLRLLGYSLEELQSLSVAEVTHPDDRAAGQLAGVASGAVAGYQADRRYLKAGGSVLWGRERVTAIPGPDGRPKLILSILEDVSERRRAEEVLRESEERFRGALENFLDPVDILSSVRDEQGAIVDFRFEFVNGANLDLAGRGAAELIGRRYLELYPSSFDTLFPLFRQVVDTGEPVVLDDVAFEEVVGGRRCSGVFDVRAMPRGDGVLLVWRDVTERRNTERALTEAHVALARHAAQLERSNQELGEFAYVASHDLSEPLRTIGGFASLLGDRYRGRLDADADDFIGFITDAVDRMQALIDALLAYSRVDSRAKPPVPVATGRVAHEAVDLLGDKIAETGGRVTFGELPTLVIDPDQLGQLLRNLLANALTFVAPGVAPVVSVSAAREPGGWRLVVTDNGIGVEARHRERIFRMFQRLHRRDEFGGSGIGLAICKKIVDRRGGRIWVEDAPGGGSRFCFTIPDALEPAP